MLGILLSYLPQHYRIISLKTSYGISPYFVLLGTTSSSSALANVLSQQKSLQDASCCSSISGFACFAGLLGVLQIATQCFCFFTMYVQSDCVVPSARTYTTFFFSAVVSPSSSPTFPASAPPRLEIARPTEPL